MEIGGSKMHDKYIHYPVVHIQIHSIRFVIPHQPITGGLRVVSSGLCVMFRIMCCVVFWIMCSGLCVLDDVCCSGLYVLGRMMHYHPYDTSILT